MHIFELYKKKKLSSSTIRRRKSKYIRDKSKLSDRERWNRLFWKPKRKVYNKKPKSIYLIREKDFIKLPKPKCPNKTAINLSKQELTTTEQSLLQKGHSFLQNPTESNWCKFTHDFTKSVDKLRHVELKPNKDLTEHDNLPEDPTKQSKLENPQQS